MRKIKTWLPILEMANVVANSISMAMSPADYGDLYIDTFDINTYSRV